MNYRQLFEALVLAVNSISAHKLRSFLTLLGVIFGVMAVVAVAAVIEGANVYVSDVITNDFGAHTVTLDKYGILDSLDAFIKAQKNKDITIDDYRALKEKVTLAQEVGIAINTTVDVVRVGNNELQDVIINGQTANMSDIVSSGTVVDSGRFISESDNEHKRNVIFIGNKLKANLFPTVDPVGKQLRIKGELFEVIGVAKAMGSILGQERDNFATIPFETHLKLFGSRQSLTILFKAINETSDEALKDQVQVMMRTRHHLSYNEKDDFGFISADAARDMWANLTGMIAVVALAVTSISLVVGGIVVMNIMMVAVTERTREIGIRKSLGARKKDILLQFLVESSLLSGVGGIIGLVVAWVLMFFVSKIFPIPFFMPLWAVTASLIVSIGVGIVFGIYPAYRAAKLDPITALRYE